MSLDDVIVFGTSFDHCLSNLEQVFTRLNDAGLKLKLSKCSLFQEEVAFLGHRVGRKGVSCDPAKIANVQDWPNPANVADVRSFLGLANYYKRFVKNFSETALPLTALTQKDQKFIWSDECEASFQTLKQHLTTAPTLAYPSLEASDSFILDTDASNFGIGAVLSQIQNGVEHVIAYASKGLTKSQRNYCTTYRELLAIVEFVPYFKHYLLGRHFDIRTDHSSLRWLHRFKDAEGLVGRWLATLANYDYEISYREGVLHGNADAMSRHPLILRRRRCGRPECQEFCGCVASPIQCCLTLSSAKSAYQASYRLWAEKSETPVVELESDDEEIDWSVPVLVSGVSHVQQEDTSESSNWIESWSAEELRAFQQADPTLKTVLGWLSESQDKPPRKAIFQSSPEIKSLCGLWPTLLVRDGILYRRWETKERGTIYQLMAPQELRAQIFKQLYGSRQGGHLGIKRSLSMIRARFFWPLAKRDVERWCRECDECAQVKDRPHHKAKLQQEPVGAKFERVAIDIMGELPLTESGNRYILVICDYFTKWTQAFPLKDQTAFTVADTLVTHCFSLFGMPRWLHSDQGSNFESELFAELCKLLDIRKTRTTPYHPQSDGMVERLNRTCQQMVKVFVNENRNDWDDHLPLLLMAYRSSPHESTGLSPNLMMFGEELPLPIDLMVGAPPRHENYYRCRTEYVEWLRQTTMRAHAFARQHLGIAATRQKDYYDRNANSPHYSVGSFVWYWYPPSANKKLGKGWTGPYRVMLRPTDIHCTLQLNPDSKPRRVHINQLKPHLGRLPVAWQGYVEQRAEAEILVEECPVVNSNSNFVPSMAPKPVVLEQVPNDYSVSEKNEVSDLDSGDEADCEVYPASTADPEEAGNSPSIVVPSQAPVNNGEGRDVQELGRGKRAKKPPSRLIAD